MNKKKSRTHRALALVLAATFALGGATPAMAYVLLTDDVVQDIEQPLHYVQLVLTEVQQYIDTIHTVWSYVQMMKQGEYFSALMGLLNETDKFFPDSDVGAFSADIGKLRDIFQGYASTYGQTKELMGEIYGAEDILDRHKKQREFQDAVFSRAGKEIGDYRAGRDLRNQRAQERLAKSENETLDVKQFQMINANLSDIYQGQSDLTMKVVTTNELLATLLATERGREQEMALTAKGAAEGVAMFVANAAGTPLPKIRRP